MTYAAAARDRYLSIPVIIITVIIIPFAAGIYFGAVGAAWLIVIGYPLKWAYIPAATAALTVWIFSMRWWLITVRQLESDAYSLARGASVITEPLVIEHRTPTPGGVQTQRVKCPVTADQLYLAAKILLPMDRRFNLRSMYPIMGQGKAVEFRDWLTREGYAIMNDRGMLEITSIGVTMLETAESRPTAPRMGEMVLFDRE